MDKKTPILIVDDEIHNLRSLERIFYTTDYDLHFASSGEAALKKVDACSPCLVILDIMMPGMDGIKVCSRIKARDEGIMVLMLSARSSLEDRMMGYQAQADDYLAKPYDPDELMAKVTILIRLHKAIKKLESLNSALERTIKKRTEELVAREQMAITGKMIKGIVHNLRGPLSVALPNTELIKMKLDNLKTVSKEDETIPKLASCISSNAEKIFEALNQLNDLVDTLLIQGGGNPSEKMQAIDLNELTQKEYRFLMTDIIIRHGVTVSLDLANNLPKIMGKYSDFSQVFYNIVKNACEAMVDSYPRQLVISTQKTCDHILMSFKDTGPGIPPDQLPQIYEPFFSTKSDHSSSDAGSGLGLFISTQLMARYHASISATNRNSSGLELTIKIPLSDNILKPSNVKDM